MPWIKAAETWDARTRKDGLCLATKLASGALFPMAQSITISRQRENGELERWRDNLRGVRRVAGRRWGILDSATPGPSVLTFGIVMQHDGNFESKTVKIDFQMKV